MNSILVSWTSVADLSIPTSGYLLYMDSGNTGDFSLLYNGTYKPGET